MGLGLDHDFLKHKGFANENKNNRTGLLKHHDGRDKKWGIYGRAGAKLELLHDVIHTWTNGEHPIITFGSKRVTPIVKHRS